MRTHFESLHNNPRLARRRLTTGLDDAVGYRGERHCTVVSLELELELELQPVAGDKKAGKRPTPSFLRPFL